MEKAVICSSDDSLEQVLEAGENVVNIIVLDSIVLRPLYRDLLGISNLLLHPQFLKKAFVFYEIILNPALENNLIEAENDQTILASSLMTHFMGVLELWVQEGITDDWLHAQVAYGFTHFLWPFANDKSIRILEKSKRDAQITLSDTALYPLFYLENGK